eukprot:1784113-Prymnesium_polylepis.1
MVTAHAGQAHLPLHMHCLVSRYSLQRTGNVWTVRVIEGGEQNLTCRMRPYSADPKASFAQRLWM